jgi:hypothetical protein
MVVGAAWRGAGFLAWDSRARFHWSDGRTTYDDVGGVAPAIRSFSDGWAAAGGDYSVARAALDALDGGGTLDELAGRLAPAMAVACAAASGVGFDPANVRAAILTTASGELEAGSFQPRRGLERYPPGSRFYIPPEGDSDALRELYEAFVAATTTAGSHSDRLRALAALYRDARALTPTLSGYLRVGILQRPPGRPWQSIRLEGEAAELAEATDAELSNAMRHEVPECAAPSSPECSP